MISSSLAGPGATVFTGKEWRDWDFGNSLNYHLDLVKAILTEQNNVYACLKILIVVDHANTDKKR